LQQLLLGPVLECEHLDTTAQAAAQDAREVCGHVIRDERVAEIEEYGAGTHDGGTL
jgi:hypothetical protein